METATPEIFDSTQAAVEQALNDLPPENMRESQTFRLEPQMAEPETSQPYIFENDDEALSRGRQIESQTVVLDLAIHGVSFSVKADPNDVIKSRENPLIEAAEIAEGQQVAEVDTRYLKMSKRLIARDCTKDLGSLDSQIKSFLRLRAVPCRLLRGGMLLIPTALVSEVDQEIMRYRTKRKELVRKFVEGYEGFKAEAQERLGTLFDAAEYPTSADITGRYKVEHRWLSFNISAALKNVSSELFAREQAKVESQWAEAADDIRAALRESMEGLIVHLTEQLKPAEDGQRKQLTSSAVENLKTFLATFEARNLTGDSDLKALADKARNLITGVDVKNLRKDAGFRETLQTNLEEIKTSLGTMVVAAKTRKITFAPEE